MVIYVLATVLHLCVLSCIRSLAKFHFICIGISLVNMCYLNPRVMTRARPCQPTGLADLESSSAETVPVDGTTDCLNTSLNKNCLSQIKLMCFDYKDSLYIKKYSKLNYMSYQVNQLWYMYLKVYSSSVGTHTKTNQQPTSNIEQPVVPLMIDNPVYVHIINTCIHL